MRTRTPELVRTAVAALILAAAPACNAITGAGDLHVGEGGASGGGAGNPGAGGHTTSHTTGTGSPDGASTGVGASGPGSTGANTTTTTTTVASTGATTSSAGPTTAVTTTTAQSSSSTGGPTCTPACGANEYCEMQTTTCQCVPGFVSQGGACTAAPPGDPSTHTQADVCAQWSAGHMVTDPRPLTASGAQCDAGTLSSGGIADTLARLNMFRWLVGLGPSVDDPSYDQGAQACANLEAWWDFSSSASPHAPPPTSTCYTASGASTAGQSNIAWGSGSPAQMIDQFVQDQGNETTLGHRRWVLNPPLDPVGIGYWETGGTYGNAACLRVFGGSGTGPNPPWNSIPPAGFTPIELAQGTWSFEGSLGGIAGATATVLRVDDATALPVTMQALSQGYGQDATSWVPQGWSAEVGKTYRVTVTGLTGGDVVYDVKPVSCP